MNTRDLVVGDKIFAIFKGDPKTRKSSAAASFPNPYIMDFDGRIRSLLKALPGKDIEYDIFTDFWDGIVKLKELNQRCDFETVIISSLTSLANSAIEYSIRYRGAEENNTKNKNKTGGLKRGQLPMTDVSDWGVEFRGLSQFIELLKSLPCHVILEAHVIEVSSTNIISGVRTVSRRLMTGAKGIAAYIPTAFDEAYHFYVEPSLDGSSNKFIVATESTGDDWAGTVLPLPPRIDWTNKNFYHDVIQHYLKNPYVPQIQEEILIP